MNIVNGRHQYSSRATASEIWLSLVDGLRASLPLRVHRSTWRRYEKCFRGDEAVHCLREYMLNDCPYYRHGVPRNKVVKLLERFRQCGIIVPVDRNFIAPFCGGNNLYRFGCEGNIRNLSHNSDSENLIALLPLSECSLKPLSCIILTPRQIELIYSDVSLEFLRDELDGLKQEGLQDALNSIEEVVDGKTIMDNMHYVDTISDCELGIIKGINEESESTLPRLVGAHFSELIQHVRAYNLSSDMIRGMLSVIAYYFRMLVPAEIIPPVCGILIRASLSSKNVRALQIALLTLPFTSYRVLQRYFLVMTNLVGQNDSLRCHVNAGVGLIASDYKSPLEDIFVLSPRVWAIPTFVRDRVDGMIDATQRTGWRHRSH